MGDRFAGEISIGGDIPRSKVQGLIDAIHSDSPEVDWGDKQINLGDPEENLDASIAKLMEFVVKDSPEETRSNEPGLLFLCDSDALYGEFNAIEAFCRENNISYNRHSKGYCEYSPERSIFHACGECTQTFDTNEDGDQMIKAEVVEALLGFDTITEIKHQIRDLIHCKTEIPPFKII